jgi:ATP-binding cassette subfamily C protein
MRLLRAHLWPQRRALLAAAVWTTLGAAPTFASGLVVAAALDHGFLVGDTAVGLALLAALAGLYGVAALSTREATPWLARSIEPMRDGLLREVAGAVLGRAVAGEQIASGGAGVAQATSQVETVRGLASALLRSARALVAPLVGAGIGLVALSPVLAAIVLPPLALSLVLYGVALRRLSARQRAVVLAGEALADAAATVLEGRRDVAACAADGWAAREVGARIDAEASATVALGRAETVRAAVLLLGVQAPLVAVLAAAPTLLAHGYVSIGAVAGAATYLVAGLQPALAALVQTGSAWILGLLVVVGRLGEATAAVAAEPAGGRVARGGALVLENVTFAWAPGADPVVDGVSLSLRTGAHLAVVGPSGIGKSTLAALAAGILRPNEGRVLLGDVDLRECDDTLRRRVALIPQEAYVFAGTLRDNLAYLRPDASDDAIRAAVRAVGLEATVARVGGPAAELPPGGGALSAGERQLVALARVWLAPADVVILDEATSHLDPAAEARAEAALAARGVTLVVVAHRISSALRAERVLVLDGASAALGTHAELVRTSPLYAELVGQWNRAAA